MLEIHMCLCFVMFQDMLSKITIFYYYNFLYLNKRLNYIKLNFFQNSFLWFFV